MAADAFGRTDTQAVVVVQSRQPSVLWWLIAFTIAVSVGAMWKVSLVEAHNEHERADLAHLAETTRESRDRLIRIEAALTTILNRNSSVETEDEEQEP